MKRLLLTTIALAALAAGPALGADLSRRPVLKAPPAPAPAYSWTGCYIGGGGGYGMWNQDTTLFDRNAASIKTTAGGSGWFGTAQVGCDYQVSSDWVVGAFGDWNFGDISGTTSIPTLNAATKEHQKWSWAAGARLGYVVIPNLLAYVSGGFTEAHFNSSEIVDAGTGAPFQLHLPATTYNGWFLGTGYEYGLKWLPGFFWKTEYRYSQYSRKTLPFIDDVTGLSFNQGIRSRPFEQTIRSELVYRFNWGGPVRY